ncbi:MAG TPA: MFS transporter [Ornithinicoccus sp.]|nr:MFS transporter [Ornithinicoccus sp.]
MRTAQQSFHPSRPGAEERLPWPALLVLGSATLVMVTGEMLPTAVLAAMSAGLGVTEASTGMLVSLWALVVVVTSFPLVRLTRAWDRTNVISASMLLLSGSALLTAVAPGYTVALAGRTMGAAAVGLLWSTVNAHVADLVPDRLLGRATAVVLGGATLGMVLGAPLGRFVADLLGWRASFALLAAASILVAWVIRRVVPGGPRHGEVARELQAGQGRPVGAMVAVTVLVGVVLVGHFGTYTYITVLADRPAGLLPGGTGTLLLLFGLASAVGVAVAARMGERTVGALEVGVGATAVALLGLLLADGHPALGLAVVVAWGVVSGTLAPLAQTLILRLAGPQHRSLAGALIPVLFNAGIAAGAALASVLVARDGVGSLPVPAAALVGVAVVGLLVVNRARAARREGSAGLGARPPSEAPDRHQDRGGRPSRASARGGAGR